MLSNTTTATTTTTAAAVTRVTTIDRGAGAVTHLSPFTFHPAHQHIDRIPKHARRCDRCTYTHTPRAEMFHVKHIPPPVSPAQNQTREERKSVRVRAHLNRLPACLPTCLTVCPPTPHPLPHVFVVLPVTAVVVCTCTCTCTCTCMYVCIHTYNSHACCVRCVCCILGGWGLVVGGWGLAKARPVAITSCCYTIPCALLPRNH